MSALLKEDTEFEEEYSTATEKYTCYTRRTTAPGEVSSDGWMYKKHYYVNGEKVKSTEWLNYRPDTTNGLCG